MRYLISIISMFVLSGCHMGNSGLLDTSKLEKEEAEGNLTEQQLDSIPAVYRTPSLETGLDAVPFKVNLPKELPFETSGFNVIEIKDWNNREDKKNISIELLAWEQLSSQMDKNVVIMIHDFKVSYVTSGIKVTLDNGTEARYNMDHKTSGGISFVDDGLYISIGYTNREEEFDKEKMLEALLSLANQMLQE
ncbi:hypothetical protein ACFSCX_19350 [Bacillus salitolerans]|uniref:Lipoprotein n=1 Tax=Bacillus salitolerans TaxID=1437434 RepID=A0ABW4LU37_9BACI